MDLDFMGYRDMFFKVQFIRHTCDALNSLSGKRSHF